MQKQKIQVTRRALQKVVTGNTLEKILKRLKRQRKRIVWTNGCFDILHVGHVRFLETAKALGDILVVALNSDASVRQFKGSDRPINAERNRAEVLAALEAVDYIIIFRSPSPLRMFQRFAPQIYVKGGDYTLETLNQKERRCLEGHGASIYFVPFVKGFSTTRIIAQFQKSVPS